MTHILSERTLGNARGDIRGRSRVLHHYGTNYFNTNNNQLQTDSTGWLRVIGCLILGARRRDTIRCRAPSSTLMGRQFAPSTLMAQDSIDATHRRAPGQFSENEPENKMIGSFVERNLQLKAFYASSTPYMMGILAEHTLRNARGNIEGRGLVLHRYNTNNDNKNNNQQQTL